MGIKTVVTFIAIIVIVSCQSNIAGDDSLKVAVKLDGSSKGKELLIESQNAISGNLETYRIWFDSLGIMASIVSESNVDSAQIFMKFHKNNNLASITQTHHNRPRANQYIFYPNGRLAREFFYVNGYPKYYGWEYWDSTVYSVTKKIYVFSQDDRGLIDSVHIYDRSGRNFTSEEVSPKFYWFSLPNVE